MNFKIKKLSYNKFLVTIVSELKTEHEISVNELFYEKISKKKISKEKLIDLSIQFLLEKETNTSILKSFELSIISNYFPDYECFIMKKLLKN